MNTALPGAGTIPRQIRTAGLPRFDFLLGALPGKEAPTDIDLALEKRGQFLFIEGKPESKIGFDRGQEIFFDALAALPGVDVLIVYGDPPDALVGYRWWRSQYHAADVWEIRQLVRDWRDEKAAA